MSHAGGCPLPERHPACGTHVADQDRLPFATLWPRISGRDLSDRDVLRPGILTVRLPAKSTCKRAYMLTPIYAASVHPKKRMRYLIQRISSRNYGESRNRKSVLKGESMSIRVDHGCGRR